MSLQLRSRPATFDAFWRQGAISKAMGEILRTGVECEWSNLRSDVRLKSRYLISLNGSPADNTQSVATMSRSHYLLHTLHTQAGVPANLAVRPYVESSTQTKVRCENTCKVDMHCRMYCAGQLRLICKVQHLVRRHLVQ